MKWRLTARFLLSILSIVIIVIFVNTAILFGLILYQQFNKFNDATADTEEIFVREFQQYIDVSNGLPSVSKEGLQQLHQRNAWIQLLDVNGQVTDAYFEPQEALSHYAPIDLIQVYKYKEFDVDTTVYVGSKDNINYLIGIKGSGVSRYVVHLSGASTLQLIGKYGLLIIIADLLVATLVGWLFGRTLTKPLYAMIERIQHLKNHKHLPIKVPKGLYRPVFENLSEVSSELAAHEQERKRLEMMREEWISNVSHDMKTPLASIRGYAELLNDRNLSPSDRTEYAQIIEKQSLHMQELLDDLNLTMRLRHQQLPLTLTEVNMVQFMREIVIDTLNTPPYEQANIDFDATAEVILHSIDEHFMRRAVVNFLYNALLHNPPDVNVHVTVDTNTITIADNGRGISAEDLAHIFERYYRGTNTEQIQGTGLGTAIARDIIEAHGGTVTILSEEQKGTTVTIQL
ncbi:HAMP domain-containing histidine kinase [Lysinibacillus sphaericus]|uniref:histidine kinase n=2 Tax=Lysinibacillus TaxID=400634 RepID=A0A2S0K5Y1_LYSSH|nr:MULTISPECIES: HAMP domain-containing sensor histidine kinase [Lysinibacillus]AVK98771.1 two-component sensor histidine kinase [Lysinibacillus sphaericus]MCS1384272.1 HAMP domain-containing histidine kinase [Lysinibacillus sphaericus]MED4543113.1 HAMP domain-containing sensor histidine kinase [Lysinibacillus sphaericus]TKI17925.1 HAMP domain-containing histidine kinase [Lysinibacillus sphaericus]TKI44917.1 HAMP domain-containing histidine kinase [Lysinibacillus tabacifolii]